MKYGILPKPKHIEEKNGKKPLKERKISFAKNDNENNIDIRVISFAEETENELLKLGITGDGSEITVTLKEELGKEAYELFIDEGGVLIAGGDGAGCYYGLCTLRQLVENEGATLPYLYINDRPDMKYRGFYHDATRGRVPSVDGIKKLVKRLSLMKINSFQLYVEHTYDFAEFGKDCTMHGRKRTEEDYLTASDIREIDEFCRDHFVDFVPSLSTFGHLYELLSSERFRHLCELEDYSDTHHFWIERMAHHTIDPSDPESEKTIFSLIDQYSENFTSEYFNICCDETFDLGEGRNRGRNRGELYCDFVSKITKHVTDSGKKVMMWGDIALAYPNALSRIPKDTILLNWDYGSDPYTEKIRRVADEGLTQIVCPGTSTWSRFIENPSVSSSNIMKMAKAGYENGALGLLNTNWGDYGHPCSPECALFGAALGAAVAWNTDTEPNGEFEKSVSKNVYGADENVIPIIYEVGNAHGTVNFGELLEYLRTGEKDIIRADEKSLEESLTVCDAVINKLSEIIDKYGDGNDVFRYVVNAAEAIKTFDRISLMIKFGIGNREENRAKAEKWLLDYRKLWLSESKESELSVIEEFVGKLL